MSIVNRIIKTWFDWFEYMYAKVTGQWGGHWPVTLHIQLWSRFAMLWHIICTDLLCLWVWVQAIFPIILTVRNLIFRVNIISLSGVISRWSSFQNSKEIDRKNINDMTNQYINRAMRSSFHSGYSFRTTKCVP